MPTKIYENMDAAYQALSDTEIEDDENNFPVAKIKVPGLHTIEIKMVSEYEYFYILSPMRDRFVNYYLNKMANVENIKDNDALMAKIKNFVNEISSIQDKTDIEKKSKTLAYIFDEEIIRYEFFCNLKKLHLIRWWVSWKKYQKTVRPIDTITIFVFLWLFNFDGVKKNAKFLLELTLANMKSHLPIASTSFGDWDTWKKRMDKASRRDRSLEPSKN